MKALIFITSILLSTSSIAQIIIGIGGGGSTSRPVVGIGGGGMDSFGPVIGGGRVAIKSLQGKVLTNHSESIHTEGPVIGGGGGGSISHTGWAGGGGGSSRTTDVYMELDLNESNSSARLAPQNLPQEDFPANRGGSGGRSYKIKDNKLIIDLSKTNIEEIRTIHGDYLYLDTIRREFIK